MTSATAIDWDGQRGEGGGFVNSEIVAMDHMHSFISVKCIDNENPVHVLRKRKNKKKLNVAPYLW